MAKEASLSPHLGAPVSLKKPRFITLNWAKLSVKSLVLLVLQLLAVLATSVFLICLLKDRSAARLEVSPSVASRFGLDAPSNGKWRRVGPVRVADTSRAISHQEDVFISVKTSGKFHESRLGVILETWFQLARDQIHFFTDTEDRELELKTSTYNFHD